MTNSSGKNSELVKRILFTLVMLAVYRVGVHVPTPGVDSVAVFSFFSAQSSGILGLFNTFSGGALAQFSIFALGVMPYISASIIFQLLTSAVPYLENLKKEGEVGRKKITQYTRYATVGLCLIQGLGISSMLTAQISPEGKALVSSAFVGILPFKAMTILTLTAGASFVMWIGEQITEKGIGNGTSLIIFTGIASSVLNGGQRLFSLVGNNELSLLAVTSLLAIMVAVVFVVVYFEVAQRRIAVHYSQKGAQGSPIANHLPIKVNFSGVIPPIFASSLLMFPATVAQFVQVPWLKSLQESLSPSGVIYNILFVTLIVFFSFFYTEIVFNTGEIAENLKKYGGFIPTVRAGKPTADFLNRVLNRLNVLGSSYLCLICVLPGFLAAVGNLPFYFGGTSLLILVGVALDTSQQIQSHLISQKYDGILNRVKVKSRRVQF